MTSPERKYRVLRDTGEKKGKGWKFNKSEHCSGTVLKNLYTADYSLDGFYDNKLFAIERKGSIAEFAANLTNKEKWDDFKQELERLEEFRHPYLVLEFDLSRLMQYPVGSGIPPYLWKTLRVKAPFLQRRVHEIELQFKTRVCFWGTGAKEHVLSLFKRMIERYPDACAV